METRAARLPELLLLFLIPVVISHIQVQELSHRILRDREPVRTSTVIYHLVIVFGDSLEAGDKTINQGIETIQEALDSNNNFSGAELIKARLSYIKEQYQELLNPKHVRSKRGLFDFFGSIGKELFGLGTDKDIQEIRKIIEDNREQLDTIVHHSNELVSVVNVTRIELAENRAAINQISNATKLLADWIERTKVRIHAGFRAVETYQALGFKADVLQDQVNHLHRVKTKILRMRKDLERGYLSEDLLPMESLRSLINSDVIPKGVEFVQPLHWYYSGLKVKLINMENELVYSVNLPLVNRDKTYATTFVSYPTPNMNSNVTIKLQVEGASLMNSLTGQVIDITNQCYGREPMVCPPLPIRRDNLDETSCKAALLRDKDVVKHCPVQVEYNMNDQFYFHDVNSFILVTRGTDLIEECVHPESLNLKQVLTG